MTWPKPCLGCQREMFPWRKRYPRDGVLRHDARGLCTQCYRAKHKAGGLDEFPPVTRGNAEVIEEWEWLRDAGYTREQAAMRMGMTFAALDRAIYRARAAERVAS